MSKIDEKMLLMMVDMAAQGGKMEAQQEAKDREIEELRREVGELRDRLAKRDERIAQLEALVFQQGNARPTVVVNQFFMLSVPRTRTYVSSLSNNGRQFVGHMLHQTLAEDTPRYVMDEVDEMTQLTPQEGGVVIQNNNGPVNGNITTQNVGSTGMGNENLLKQIDDNGREEGVDR